MEGALSPSLVQRLVTDALASSLQDRLPSFLNEK